MDLRADLQTGTYLVSLLIECKKNNPEFTDWVFLRKEGVYAGEPLRLSQIAKGLRPNATAISEGLDVETRLASIPWNAPIADDGRETRGTYEGYKKQDKTRTSNAAVSEAAAQVALATQAIVAEEARHAQVLGTPSPGRVVQVDHLQHSLIPVIVTTARLHLIDMDAADVDSRSGEIPLDKAKMTPCSHLRFEFPLPKSHQSAPLEMARVLEQRSLYLFSHMQIVVVQSEEFEGFLQRFAADPNNPFREFPP